MSPELPDTEWRTMRMTVEGAEELALNGQVSEARACLVAGIARAQVLCEGGANWGELLLQHYQEALESLDRRFTG